MTTSTLIVNKCKDCKGFRETSRLGCYCFFRLLTDGDRPTKIDDREQDACEDFKEKDSFQRRDY